jgi:hypothetical protein
MLKSRGAGLDLMWIERGEHVPADMLTNDAYTMEQACLLVLSPPCPAAESPQ